MSNPVSVCPCSGNSTIKELKRKNLATNHAQDLDEIHASHTDA
jgi:hypothetical protein